MSLSISIRFLTGRAHLHPWQTHHSEGRVEWPPSQWRLLRALVAVAGRGLTTLPYPDEGPPLKPEPKATVEGISSLKKREVPKEAQGKLSLSKAGVLTLKESLTDAEALTWKAANPSESFSAALDCVRALASAPEPLAMADDKSDVIPLSRLAAILEKLAAKPTIWLPKTAGGHTRQYFPIHDAGMVKNTGSAVFDTFATLRKDQPIVFHWPNVEIESLEDLNRLLCRMTYFGRAESWCQAEAGTQRPDCLSANPQTHWECVCIDENGTKPVGQEYRDYTLERRLAPCSDVKSEVVKFLPRTNILATDLRPSDKSAFAAILEAEDPRVSLLRCLLRESGQDIKDGLDRPIGTRWVHYAVPRAIYDVPRPSPARPVRPKEAVDLVVYALNTATVNRPVLPALTDTLLVADHFRSAAIALCRSPSPLLSGHETTGEPCKGHDHAFWWPRDEDNDGFIDRVFVHARGGFQPNEADALRRLSRLRQRGGRPDLLVTPIFVGQADNYGPWVGRNRLNFVSATPYFCPLHLSHGRTGGSRIRPVTPVIRGALLRQGIIHNVNEVESIQELVFDYDPDTIPAPTVVAANSGAIPPRQFFPVIEAPSNTMPLADQFGGYSPSYPRERGACRKDPDQGHPFGLSVGLFVSDGTRFLRSLAFCRNRRGHQVNGYGRMLEIRFREPKTARPFAIGSECHFGLGLFVSTDITPSRESVLG